MNRAIDSMINKENAMIFVEYEERDHFKNYFQLYYNCGRFGAVYQDMNMNWCVQIDRSDYDRHTFKHRTMAMDYIEHELRVTEVIPFDYIISRPRYKK